MTNPFRRKPKLSAKDIAFLQAFAFHGENEVWENVLIRLKDNFDAAVSDTLEAEKSAEARAYDAGYAKAYVDAYNDLLDLRRQALEIDG